MKNKLKIALVTAFISMYINLVFADGHSNCKNSKCWAGGGLVWCQLCQLRRNKLVAKLIKKVSLILLALQ